MSVQVIKKELGMEKDDTETVIEKYMARLAELTVPEAAQVVIDEEINKLRFLDSHSSEFSVTRWENLESLSTYLFYALNNAVAILS